MDSNELLRAASFKEMHDAIIEASVRYEALKEDESVGAILAHYINNLSEMALKKIGFVAEPEEPVKKKRKGHGMSPENKAKAAQRMRDMQARHKAEKEKKEQF